jgi:hypothetical protein
MSTMSTYQCNECYGFSVPFNCSAEELHFEEIIWQNFERKTKNGKIYERFKLFLTLILDQVEFA